MCTIEVGNQATNARSRREQRRRLTADAGDVTNLGPSRVVRVPKFLDLALAQPTNRARQQASYLRAQGRRDLGRPRQQKVAGENRLQVSPLGVDRVDAAACVRFIHHVVVVERSGLHELAGDTALYRFFSQLGVGNACDLRGDDGQHRPQTLPTSDDEVRGDFLQVRVGCVHRFLQRGLDPRDGLCVAGKCKQWRGRHVARLRHIPEHG